MHTLFIHQGASDRIADKPEERTQSQRTEAARQSSSSSSEGAVLPSELVDLCLDPLDLHCLRIHELHERVALLHLLRVGGKQAG